MYLWTSWILHLQLGTSKLYLEPLLKTFETPGAFIWNPYLEPWNLPKLYLRTFAGNLDRHLEPSRTYTLTWMEPICFTWNLGIFRNLYLEPLLGTSEPSGTLYDWNPYLEPRNLPEPLLGTLILGTSEPAGTLLGTLTRNLGTCQNLAGWLPQSAPGLSLARTPKLSAVGEKQKKNPSLNGNTKHRDLVGRLDLSSWRTVKNLCWDDVVSLFHGVQLQNNPSSIFESPVQGCVLKPRSKWN